jgi:hypothetical protein
MKNNPGSELSEATAMAQQGRTSPYDVTPLKSTYDNMSPSSLSLHESVLKHIKENPGTSYSDALREVETRGR